MKSDTYKKVVIARWFDVGPVCPTLSRPARTHWGEAMYISLTDFQWNNTEITGFQYR